MQPTLGSLFEMGGSRDWLIAANFVLLLLIGLMALRYRTMWMSAADEHKNSRELIENLSEGIYRTTLDGRQLSANRALVELNGYSSEAEMMAVVTDIGKEWYVDPERRSEFRRLLHHDGVVDNFVSEIYRHKTRERIWVSESARIVRHKRTGKPLFYEGSVRDVSETVKRLNLKEHYKKLISQVPGGLFQFRRDDDRSLTFTYANAGFRRLIGMLDEDKPLTPADFVSLVVNSDLEGFNASLRECFRTLTGWDHEFRICTPAGEEKWLRATAAPEPIDGAVVWHGYASDISLRKRQEMEIRDLAFFDSLTRLPNRRMLLDGLTRTLPNCRAQDNRGALLFIDLDNFKTLNDTQGHDSGDAYLVQVAGRLQRCVRKHDLVARIGGDEFVIVLDNAGVDEAAATSRAIMVAGQVLRELNSAFQIGTILHQASASVGIVVFDGTETRVDELLKRADIAMYKAKAAGRNAMAIFDQDSMRRQNERYRLVSELRAAIAADQFVLHFQPQVDRTGRVCAAEALVRWRHPERGIVTPDDFIPLAEQSGLINDIGRLVMQKGIATLAAWADDPATAHLRLAINVSVKSFESDDFLPHLKRLLATLRIDPKRLTLEFTEHVMADNQADTARRMRELKRLGISFSLDDFGTGYSSLAYLKELPFDEIKIDGSFVADIETNESDRALVRTILAMATTLGLKSVAEHVENERQEAFLDSFGCDIFQGYHYSRPLAPADFLAYLHTNDQQPGSPLSLCRTA